MRIPDSPPAAIRAERIPLVYIHSASHSGSTLLTLRLARHPQVGTLTLDELMARQRDWFAQRAADWNAYAARVGRRIDDPAGWPLAG